MKRLIFELQRFAGVTINNTLDNSLVAGSADADSIYNSGTNVTIDGGAGNDLVSLNNSYATNAWIVYNEGDGNDTIDYSSGNATIQIASGELKSITSTDGKNLLLHVGDDTITVLNGWRFLEDRYGRLKIFDAEDNDLLSSITPVLLADS